MKTGKRYQTYRKSETDSDPLENFLPRSQSGQNENESVSNRSRSIVQFVLLFAIAATLSLYFFREISSNFNTSLPSIANIIPFNQPGEDLLNEMNELMTEMGYLGLTHDELRELRSEGVTATYISNIRSLGYTDLTLDDAIRLAQADVSSAFAAMMIELGYNPGIEELIDLRRAGVTAYYTSNLHDLGYRDVTPEQLIRLQRIGVSIGLVERLQEERGEDIPLDEIIRFQISNQ